MRCQREGRVFMHETINMCQTDENYNEYIVWFSNDDNIKIKIKQEPNKVDDYELILDYISKNHEPMANEIIEINKLKCIVL